MNLRKKNQLYVSLFLLAVLAFTAVMTFWVGPIMMAKREKMIEDKVLFKCQKVVDGSSIDIQMRDWQRPNPNPVFAVHFAGIDAPPLGKADDPEVIEWAEKHSLSPAVVADLGESAYKTLLAFIRKQNLFLYREDGSRGTEDLSPDSYVHVFVSGSHVNLKQLRSGLALHDSSRPHAYAEAYAKAAAEAKAEKRGLWSR